MLPNNKPSESGPSGDGIWSHTPRHLTTPGN